MDQFTAQQRGIFAYHNGIEEVLGDPLEILDTMIHLLGCHPNQALKAIGKIVAREQEDGTFEYDAIGPIGLPALESLRKFSEAIDQAFQMSPFDPKAGVGVTRALRWRA